MTATTEAAEEAARQMFAHLDRGFEGTTKLRFLNNGGRSQLVLTCHDGTAIRLAPTLHRAIDRDFMAAAHMWARAAYGPRRAWPACLTAERATA